MALTISVPSIACEVCGQTITKAIQNHSPGAVVTVDVAGKAITVEGIADETTLRAIVTEAGHTPA